MKSVHLVIPDLFLPKDIAAEACADMHLPALEKLLARGVSTGSDPSADSGRAGEGGCLENHLSRLFGMAGSGGAPVASVSAAFDGLGAGCWLRADPVHLRLQRDQMLLLPNPDIDADEAGQICASLNKHFAEQGMEFFAPHPLRWYVRFDHVPVIETVPLSQAYGRNVHGLLPRGAEATRWHQLFNEIQMLLYAHPLNDAREARGELTINSVWFWGGGCDTSLANMQKNYQSAHSDEVLVAMFAAAAGVPFTEWQAQWKDSPTLSQGERGDTPDGMRLLVWTGLRSALQHGDYAAWRTALLDFETGYAQPLWKALRSGKIAQLQLEILGENNVRRILLKRPDTWTFWRRDRQLLEYS